MNFDIKGLDKLMMGLAKFKLRHPSKRFNLLVVGKGDDRKYSKLAYNLGIKDQVVFSGVVQKEILDQIYTACDIFSMPSKFDTFGMSVLEAMAASLPVIISGKVGAKDLLKEGVNGFVIENTDNADEISSRIALMMDEEVRTRMGKEAFKTASRNTWEAVAKEVGDIYKSFLA
jgi:UDP-glucose:(heptosyl)LPS alpha-1,3-glucosyltransferase